MHLLTDLFDSLNSGIVTLKESTDGTTQNTPHQYMYLTRNPNYINFLYRDMPSVAQAINTELKEGCADIDACRNDYMTNAAKGWLAVNIHTRSVVRFHPHFFTGVASQVAFTISPTESYANYPDGLLALGQRDRLKKATQDLDALELSLLETIKGRYLQEDSPLSRFVDLNMIVSKANTDEDIEGVLFMESPDKGDILISLSASGEEGVMNVPQAALLALFEGNTLTLTAKSGNQYDLMFGIKDDAFDALAERANEGAESTLIATHDGSFVFEKTGSEGSVSTALALNDTDVSMTPVVLREKFGFIHTSRTQGTWFSIDKEDEAAHPCVALLVKSPQNDYDWHFYLTKAA